jgi:hypothetical protein
VPKADFAPQNAIEELLIDAYRDPAKMSAFYKAFWEGDVYLQQSRPSSDVGWRVTQEGETIDAPNVMLDGKPFVKVFTSEAQLAAQAPGASFVRIAVKALMTMLPSEQGLLINPGAQVSYQMIGPEFHRLPAAAPIPLAQELPAGTRVFVGEPATLPPGLLEGVSNVCSSSANVMSAYRAQVYFPDSGSPPHLAFGVMFDGPVDEAVLLRIDAVVVGFGLDHPTMLSLRANDDGAVGGYMIRETRPFFKRKGKTHGASKPWQELFGKR